MQEILLKIRYFERGLSKSLKKVNFIFSFELMGKININKRGVELVTSCSSGYKIGLEKFLYPKITSANLCQPIHDIINYFTSFWPFGSAKFGKEGKKLQKFEFLENEKLESFFIAFKGYHLMKK